MPHDKSCILFVHLVVHGTAQLSRGKEIEELRQPLYCRHKGFQRYEITTTLDWMCYVVPGLSV